MCSASRCQFSGLFAAISHSRFPQNFAPVALGPRADLASPGRAVARRAQYRPAVRNVDDVECSSRRGWECSNGRRVEVFGLLRTRMYHLGIGVLELDSARPSLCADSALHDDFDQPPRSRHTAGAGDLPSLPQ